LDDIRLLKLLKKEIFNLDECVLIHEDNISANTIASGGEQKRTRALMIKCYDLLQAKSDGEIKICKISGKTQLADIFMTKALHTQRLYELLQSIFVSHHF